MLYYYFYIHSRAEYSNGNPDFTSLYQQLEFPEIFEMYIMGNMAEVAQEYPEVFASKARYLDTYFCDNYFSLKKFNKEPSEKNLEILASSLEHSNHEACVVFKYTDDLCDESILFTGDATNSVFTRLLNNGIDLHCRYMKMPHHGSKYNLREKNLRAIAPEIAIISHNNGHKKGPDGDPHPHKETLNLLTKHGVKIITTNNIIKDGVNIINKSNNYPSSVVHVKG